MSQPECADLARAVVEGDAPRARALAEAWVEARGDLLQAVEEGFAAGIRRVGELWEEGEYFLPELIQGAEAMKAAMEVLQPHLRAAHSDRPALGRVVLGTIQGDLHDIGKGLVGTMLSAYGFEVLDLGSDVPVTAFVENAAGFGAEIVAASALLTTTMVRQRELADALRAACLPSSPRLLIGGAPATPAWAAEIGAAYAENALRAVEVARELVAGRG
jgi:trimethylamine corrinoid protein